MVMKVAIAWNDYWNDYKSNVRKVIEPRYIVDESHKYSDELDEYTNPIIQKENGYI